MTAIELPPPTGPRCMRCAAEVPPRSDWRLCGLCRMAANLEVWRLQLATSILCDLPDGGSYRSAPDFRLRADLADAVLQHQWRRDLSSPQAAGGAS